MTKNDRIVFMFSGGADAAAAVCSLAEDFTVVTLTLDVGQGHELTGVRERALASGASRAHVLDVRDELARKYFWPAVQAGRPFLTCPGELLAPLVAAKLIELAKIEEARAVAHEWSGEDALRVEEAVRALDPELEVRAPLSSAALSALDEATLWSSARLAAGTPFELTRNAADAPPEGASIEISFCNGLPERLNGIDMSLVEAIESLETLAGAHGVGRVPLKGNGWIEAPAAVVLEIAYAALSAATSHGPLDGTVVLRLRQGYCAVVSCSRREAPLAIASTESR
ncbi:MAG TPA: argininosuccinate synthase domain-containing protein [Vicinamibacterales bacterium]|jgi:argininosuccinate synthase|nr:argininosuccinate synthase domain-containing protein [Vicinamibacterales bacterium]